jgi:hypothetical protein
MHIKVTNGYFVMYAYRQMLRMKVIRINIIQYYNLLQRGRAAMVATGWHVTADTAAYITDFFDFPLLLL